MQTKMEDMMDQDEEIVEQHKKLFEVLEDRGDTPSGYSYN